MSSYDVIVVGAGISGLYAANQLAAQHNNNKVLVLEATERIGGRVRVDQIDKFAPGAHLHVGAEFLHGKSKSKIMDIVQNIGLEAVELPAWPDYLYYVVDRQSPELIKYDHAVERDPKLESAVEACYQLKHLPFSTDLGKSDISADRYLLDVCKISNRHFQLVDAAFANDMGESYVNTGLDELIQENISWTYGDEYLIVPQGLHSITKYLAQGLNIQLRSPVIKIDYFQSDGLVKVTTKNEAGLGTSELFAKRVLVTVPLGVLKADMIHFSPPLPLEKVKAIESIGFSPAIKVFLKFSRRFWPKDLFDVVCADSVFPELWTISSKYKGKTSSGYELVTFFTMGAKARKLISTVSSKKLVDLCLEQMNEVFGSKLQQPSKPVFEYFLDSKVYIWDEDHAPYARGGYSYPTPNAHRQRVMLAKPMKSLENLKRGVHCNSTAGQVFFAGEACSLGVNPCLHGAIETAEIAVKSIRESF